MMAAHVGCSWTCFQIVAGELRCGHVEGLDQVRHYIPVPAWCSPALLTTPFCCALLHVDLPTTLTCHCSCQLLPAPESLALFATGIICAADATKPASCKLTDVSQIIGYDKLCAQVLCAQMR